MSKEIQGLIIQGSSGERLTRASLKDKAFVLEKGHVVVEAEEMNLLDD